MQPSRNKLKIPVLIFFIFLLSGFVVYRSGGLDDFFKPTYDNNEKKAADLNVDNEIAPDTLPQPKADSSTTILSTSKSIILIDEKMKKRIRREDSIIRMLHKKFSDSVGEEKLIFSGSKSGPIIKPEIFKIDTSKKRQ